MSLSFRVWWSIYVQCKHKNKLINVHLPAIEQAIGQPDAGWAIEIEEFVPEQFRVVTQFDLRASGKDEAAMAVIKNSFALHEGNWSFLGLSSLNTDQPLYIMASLKIETPRHRPPAITNVMLEVEQHIVRSNGDR